SISRGEKSFSNLINIPALPSSGYEALKELDRKGLILMSWETVSLTAEFVPWLEAQRNASAGVQRLDKPQSIQPVAIPEAANRPAATGTTVIRTHRREVFRHRWSKLSDLENWQTAIINFLD